MPEFQYNNNNVVLAYHYGKSINYGLFRNLTIMEPAQKVLVWDMMSFFMIEYICWHFGEEDFKFDVKTHKFFNHWPTASDIFKDNRV